MTRLRITRQYSTELVYRPYQSSYQQDISDIYSYFTDAVIKDVTNDLMERERIFRSQWPATWSPQAA